MPSFFGVEIPLPTTPGILILEGDADRLRHERHSLIADAVERWLQPLKQQGKLRVTRLAFRTQVDVEIARLTAQYARYDGIILIAHGSPSSIDVAAGVSMRWEEFAAAMAPLRPKALLAISCFGGLSTVATKLFGATESLVRVIGSPAPLSVGQAMFATVELIATALGGDWPSDLSFIFNAYNALLTDGVIYSRTRDGHARTSEGDALVEDLLGLFAHAYLQGRRGGGRLPRLAPARAHVRRVRVSAATSRYRLALARMRAASRRRTT